MPKYPTGEHVRAVVADIATFHQSSKYPPEMWHIKRIEYLSDLPVECYHVVYQYGGSAVFRRDERGKLIPCGTWTYEASDNFEDRHKSSEQDSTPESEARDV